MLRGRRDDHIGETAIAHRPIGREAHAAGRRDDPAAPVAEAIAISRDRYGRADSEVIGHYDVGRPRKMRAEHRDQRRWLRKVINHFEADTNLHAKHLVSIACAIRKMVRRHQRATSSAHLPSSLVVKLEATSADIGRVAQTIGHADFWKLLRRTAEMVT